MTEEIRNQERKPTLIAVKQLEPIKRCERLLCEDKLTPAAKTLNDEQLALIYGDILKPLDFASILHERRKLADRQQVKNSGTALCIVLYNFRPCSFHLTTENMTVQPRKIVVLLKITLTRAGLSAQIIL